MPVGLLTLEIQLPYAHSLKEKRAVLQKLMNRLRARFNAAAAELDHQDVWQRSTVAVVTVSSSQPAVESSLRRILEESEKILGQDVASYSLDYFD
ncbi:MAG: DUF503 domain-containing protein [Terriglobia bacterium]